jgi:RNA polymerase sigma-32 factor
MFQSSKILSAVEQKQLVIRWQTNNDPAALNRLVQSNVRAVTKEAHKIRSKNPFISLEDLIQEGLEGLVKAATKFDMNKEVTFLTYGMWWVRANMRRYILDYKSVVRIGTTRADRILFSNLSSALKRADDKNLEGEEKIKFVSTELGVNQEYVGKMISILKNGDLRLDEAVGEDSETTRLDNLQDMTDYEKVWNNTYQNDEIYSAVSEIMGGLPDDEKIVITNRFSPNPKTLRDLAKEMGISREWVRKIEARGLDRVRKRLIQNYGIQSYS